jgi:glycosyltransferase involved in cell wall biosynthesis
MRIILVNKFHYRKGGAETYYLTIGEKLKEMGHEVAYFSMKHPDNLPCAQEKYFVTQREYNNVKNPLTAARDGLALLYSNEAKHNFEELCEDFHPDIVHMSNVHRQITLSILDAPYLSEHHVPVVYTAHDYVTICPGYLMLDGSGNVCDACLDGKYRHCIERVCVKGSRAKSALAAAEASFNRGHHMNEKIDKVIAPSRFMRSKLIEGGWPEDKVVFMQNFASDEILDRASSTGDNTDREHPYILFFGRLSFEKGIDVLVHAFSEALPNLPSGLRLVIAGDGPEKDAIESFVNKANFPIELVGYKTGEELKSLVAGALLAVSPSVWRENMPYSIIEALAEGTPVIGSRIGGIPELISDDETGWLCEPGDKASLARTLVQGVQAASNMVGYRVMQDSCRRYVVSHCSQMAYMETLVNLYDAQLQVPEDNIECK